MPWPSWRVAEQRTLAKYVVPEAASLVRLPVSRPDLGEDAAARAQIVRLVYDALCSRGIRYAPEKYQSDLRSQPIRTPQEILEKPGEGTCLDLAVLFSGICLGFDLLPFLIVLRGHAFAAVSLEYGRREWDSLSRKDRALFERGLLDGGSVERAEAVRQLLDGRWLPVECTGFSQSKSLNPSLAEAGGRDREGLLSFERAAAAAREQLTFADRALDFIIDVTELQENWDLKPYRPEDQTSSPQPALVLDLFESNDSTRFFYGARRVPLIGRDSELKQLEAFLDVEPMVRWHSVCGQPGTGESRLALELCLLHQTHWRSGWLAEPFDSWRTWQPEAPTLIVIDDAAGRAA